MGVGLWSGVAEEKYSVIYFGVCMYMYDIQCKCNI